MNYIGEHLLPGQLGHFFVILSLVASLIATIAYAKSANAVQLTEAESWKRMGRIAFIVDAISVFSIFALIFILISRHYYEYYYAWNHSDKTLEPKYLLSSIWEGQEGSFLLWTLWHAVLGMILTRTARKWEAPVMAVVSFAQVCLATMILGVYIFEVKIGSTPFMLLRNTEFMSADKAPFLHTGEGLLKTDYLQFIYRSGGKGLNQLLQNYWMVIHPPILFLGFASTIVPFAFAIAGLWKKDYGGWTKAALPWSLFSGAILSLGIMMGAKWAYESLNFGGYWAWDPVENASLVPWLVMVAGIHTQLVYNSTGRSLRSTYFFFILSFVLILYSTYLTRSGDLQDTSVHAFTDQGMNWQLRALVAVFAIPSLTLFITRYKKIPAIANEESSYSREFWMFIGSLVLFLSSLVIITTTSLPVINKIFGTKFSLGEEVAFSYNRIQVFVAIVIGVLTAFSQYLKYKDTPKPVFLRTMLLPTLVAAVTAGSISLFGNVNYNKFGLGFLVAIHLAIFAAVYAIVANATYIGAGLKGKIKSAGAAVAHVGFGILLLGVLISSSKEKVLSTNFINPLNFGPSQKEKGVENLTLYQGVPTDMGSYWITYQRDSLSDNARQTFFHVFMQKKDSSEQFTLQPDFIKATKGQEGVSYNPDARHYWNRDIFTYVSYSEIREQDTAQFRRHSMAVGDTLFYSAGYMILDKTTLNPANARVRFGRSDTAIQANLRIVTADSQTLHAQPVYYVKNNEANYLMDTVYSQGLAIGFSRIVDARHVEISVKESSRLVPFIALKVLEFPFINLVWIGTVIMIIGFLMSVIRRVSLLQNR